MAYETRLRGQMATFSGLEAETLTRGLTSLLKSEQIGIYIKNISTKTISYNNVQIMSNTVNR